MRVNFEISPLSWLGLNTPVAAPAATPPAKTVEPYKNEFHQVYYEFVNELSAFRDKYPLVSVVAMVFFLTLGLVNVFSFSLSNILSGVTFLTLSGSLAMSIGKKGWGFWPGVKDSIMKLFQAYGPQPTSISS